MIKRKQWWLLLLAISLILLIGCQRKSRRVFEGIITITGTGAMETAPEQPTQTVEKINTSWADNEITATGIAVPPPDAVSKAQARLMAKRGAKVEALRNLTETLEGVNIDSSTTVKNFLTQNDEINAWTRSWIQGARVISENELPDGSWEVTVGLNLEPLGRKYEDVMGPGESVAVAPQTTNIAQQKAMAKRAAYLDAQRQLLEYVKGLAVDSNSTVENFMLKSDSIRSAVQGYVRGAKIVDTRYLDDGTVEVDIQFDLSNLNSCIR